jgi:hypothetical protein
MMPSGAADEGVRQQEDGNITSIACTRQRPNALLGDGARLRPPGSAAAESKLPEALARQQQCLTERYSVMMPIAVSRARG